MTVPYIEYPDKASNYYNNCLKLAKVHDPLTCMKPNEVYADTTPLRLTRMLLMIYTLAQ